MTEQIQIQFFTELQSQKHSTVTIQSQSSVIRSQNQQVIATAHCSHSTVVSA